MNRAGRALVAVLFLIAGAAAVYVAPTTPDVMRPIASRGEIGDRIVGRAFASTVTRVRFADTLRLRDGRSVSTPGVWLVVDLRVTPRLNAALLRSSTVRVGRTTFGVYDDPTSSDFSAVSPDPGITTEGTLAFELPDRVRDAGAADLVISRGSDNPDQENVTRLDPRRIRSVAGVDVARASPVTLEFPWGR